MTNGSLSVSNVQGNNVDCLQSCPRPDPWNCSDLSILWDGDSGPISCCEVRKATTLAAKDATEMTLNIHQVENVGNEAFFG